jgi:hypothetical protein
VLGFSGKVERSARRDHWIAPRREWRAFLVTLFLTSSISGSSVVLSLEHSGLDFHLRWCMELSNFFWCVSKVFSPNFDANLFQVMPVSRSHPELCQRRRVLYSIPTSTSSATSTITSSGSSGKVPVQLQRGRSVFRESAPPHCPDVHTFHTRHMPIMHHMLHRD